MSDGVSRLVIFASHKVNTPKGGLRAASADPCSLLRRFGSLLKGVVTLCCVGVPLRG